MRIKQDALVPTGILTEELDPILVQLDHKVPPIINVFTPRRSSRNDYIDEWTKRNIGITSAINTYRIEDSADRHPNLYRQEFIKKLDPTAISPIAEEMMQIVDMDVIQGRTNR